MADDLRIVTVDDSRVALAQLESVVDGVEGAEVVGSVRDGASAIRAVAELEPDLVMMDIVMPDMDGLSALRVIMANHPEVRVALVTSLGGSGSHAEEAFRLGAIQVIAKPFEPELIEALVEGEREHRDAESKRGS
ncbi:MAG: response regulator [Deltaproteobacteria bacterium]|nr:response regulator [Deltaproteobacteria bacterium]MBW2417466.1 response regulator [Deltaproteobacteria bacterium]